MNITASPLIRVVFSLSYFSFSLSTKAAWLLPLGNFPEYSDSSIKSISADGRYVIGSEDNYSYCWDLGDQTLGEYPKNLKIAYLKGLNKKFLNLSKNGKMIVSRKANIAHYKLGNQMFMPLEGFHEEKESYALFSTASGHSIVGSCGGIACKWRYNKDKQDFRIYSLKLEGLTSSKHLGSLASSINENGKVITGWVYTSSETIGFKWTKNDGIKPIGHLIGGEQTYPLAISSDGSTIVGKSNQKAFRYVKSDASYLGEMLHLSDEYKMEDLGTLSKEKQTTAWAVSKNGSTIVGRSGDDAFIWTEKNGMQNLQDVLCDKYNLGQMLKGWHLSNASAISDDGLHIAGTAVNNFGKKQAFVVYIGETIIEQI